MPMKAISLEQQITFTRPSPADYEAASGQTQTALANEPRLNYSNGQFQGLLLDSLLDEIASLEAIDGFSHADGAFILEGELEDVLCFPGLGVTQSLTGSGTVVFSYRDGVCRCYANKQTLFTIPSFEAGTPNALTAGGVGSVKHWAYFRNLSESALKRLSEGDFVVSERPALYVDMKGQEYGFRDSDGAFKRRSYSDIFNLARPGPTTAWNAQGQLVEVPAGQPAYDHDPLTGEPLGQRIEAVGDTNHYPSTTSIADNFTIQGVVVTPNAALAPDGTMTMEQVEQSVANEFPNRFWRGGFAATEGQEVWVEFFIKNVPGSIDKLSLRFTGDWSTSLGTTFSIDPSNGEYQEAGNETVVEKIPGGFHVRIRATQNASGTSSYVQFYVLNPAGERFGGGTGGVYTWGWQWKTSRSSFIPTDGSAVTRSVDVASLDGLQSADWFGDTMTWVAEFTPRSFGVVADGPTNQSRIVGSLIRTVGGSGSAVYGSYDGDNVLYSSVTPIIGETYKIAMAYSPVTNEMKMCINGGSVNKSPYNGVFSGLADIPLVSGVDDCADVAFLNAKRSYATDAEMQELTS